MGDNTSAIVGEYHRRGDFIVGHPDHTQRSYKEQGAKVMDGTAVGTPEELQERVERFIRASPGVEYVAPDKVKQKKIEKNVRTLAKKVKANATYVNPTPKPERVKPAEPVEGANPRISIATSTSAKPEPKELTPGIEIVFRNKFGRIMLNVSSILEEDYSICLIFASERDLHFIPEQGEELELTINKQRTIKVFYPGFLFTWLDNRKKIMILAKVIEDTQYAPERTTDSSTDSTY